jgi:hypothetical protein
MKPWRGLLFLQWAVIFSIVVEWTEALSSAASAAEWTDDIAGAFDAWLDAHGAHREVRTRDFRAAGLGFGFEATRALHPDDRVLLVPLRLHVAASNALRRSSAAPWFFAGAKQRWSFAEQPFVLFWLHEAAVRGRNSFYAPYLRLMAASMRCPHRGSAVGTENATTNSATHEESAETDPVPALESTDAWQRSWAWLDAHHTPDCSHPLYWSGGAAEWHTAFQRASAADDVVALWRSLRARYRDTIDRFIAPHAAHTGLAPNMVTFHDFVWAFLLHGSRTWALPRFQPPPADDDSLRALRAELASRLFASAPPSGCTASSPSESSAADNGAAAIGASCQTLTSARGTSALNDVSASAFVPPWTDADERDAAIAVSEGHTFLPGIDVFNHVRRAPDVAMRVTRDGLYAEAVALRPIAAGAQVWISYGPQANFGMLLGFNFALAPVRFRALAPFAARGDAEFVHAAADAATTTAAATTAGAVHEMHGTSRASERLRSLVAIAADYLAEATTANHESTLDTSSAASTRLRRGTSVVPFLPVRSNVTVLALSVALPPALLTPPLVAIFAGAGVDAHRIRVPITAAYASFSLSLSLSLSCGAFGIFPLFCVRVIKKL